jgi:glucose-1-phosphate thymidylyltransferase
VEENDSHLKAVILARGLGTRMRQPEPRAALSGEQASIAATGLKAMIPTAAGRPFLDYVLTSLADAGYTDIGLVIGPEHQVVRDYYARVAPQRLRITFAEQQHPKGTADAVLAAETFVDGGPFLVLNADNLYPVDVLVGMDRLGEPGLPGFSARALLADGQIPPERLARFAVLDVGADGYLRRVIEKPDAVTLATFGPDPVISMNLWRFDAAIFDACRGIAPSPRGELELQAAVQVAIERGTRFKVFPVQAAVLDLSSRGDIAAVAERLKEMKVDL